jgi:hypothetical protein
MNGKTEMPTAENTSRAVLIAEAENRLQLNVFVSIFFCTLLYSFYRSLDKSDVQANKILVHWAAVPACYLLSYIVFESGKSMIVQWALKLTSFLLLVASALFVLPMSMIAAADAKWFRMELLLGILSFQGIPIIALLLNLPIMIGIGAGLKAEWREEKPVRKLIVHALRKRWAELWKKKAAKEK